MLRSVKPSAILLSSLLLSTAVGCTGDDPDPDTGPTEVSFASDFLWGSATAGFQIESGLDDTAWGIWAGLKGSGDDPNDGPDALNHIDGDIELMGQAGLVAYRFSVEMARVYPTRQAFDDDAPSMEGLAKYDELVDKLKAVGITPQPTLHHFVWPSYMSDPTKASMPQSTFGSPSTNRRSRPPWAIWRLCFRLGSATSIEWWRS